MNRKRQTKRPARRTRFDELVDPAPVRDVRKWRAALLKKAGGTIEGLVEYCYGPKSAQRRTPPRRKSA